MTTQRNTREVLAIFGKDGMGKTRFVQNRISEWTRAVIVEGGFDGEKEFPGVKVESLRDLMDYLEENRDGLFRVRMVPTSAEFPIVCDMVGAVGSCHFVIDEADRFIHDKKLDVEFLELIRRGRHFGDVGGAGVSLIAMSANPYDFPIDFRRAITRAVIFNTAEPNDVEWLTKLFGSSQKEWAEKCAMLQAGEFIEWVRGEGCREGHL